MSGYDFELWMSNNAVQAYQSGLLPASKIGRIPARLIAKFCEPAEWHHGSKAFNEVRFYVPAEVLAAFGLQSHDDYEPNPQAIAALAEYKAERKARAVAVYENCTVEWLHWSGSIKHPTCSERQETGATVEVRSQTAVITFQDGRKLKKRLTTRGFSFRPCQELAA